MPVELFQQSTEALYRLRLYQSSLPTPWRQSPRYKIIAQQIPVPLAATSLSHMPTFTASHAYHQLQALLHFSLQILFPDPIHSLCSILPKLIKIVANARTFQLPHRSSLSRGSDQIPTPLPPYSIIRLECLLNPFGGLHLCQQLAQDIRILNGHPSSRALVRRRCMSGVANHRNTAVVERLCGEMMEYCPDIGIPHHADDLLHRQSEVLEVLVDVFGGGRNDPFGFVPG